MQAALLTVGDELLIGQIVNTNASWMGESLNDIGVSVEQMITVGDDAPAIISTLNRLNGNIDLLLITGGLGPTHDDLTKKAVADYAGVGMSTDPEVLAHLEAFYKQRGRAFTAARAEMAVVPEQFEVLRNSVGSAPGLWYTHPGDRLMHIALMPGVPYEMKAIMQEEVMPRLHAMPGTLEIQQVHLLTAGIGEADLARKIGDVSPFLGKNVKLAYLPNAETGVRLRLTVHGHEAAPAQEKLDAFEAYIRSRIGPHIYGTKGDTLEAVVGQLLVDQGRTIALAESCTGGLIADRLTNVPGSSAYVMGGVVAYDNAVKEEILKVPPEVINAHGAVSEAVAIHMAQGIRRIMKTDVGVSTTGIAGPGGGTPDKPVGTVWFAYVDANAVYSRKLRLTKQRRLNKVLTSMVGLNIIRLQLEGIRLTH